MTGPPVVVAWVIAVVTGMGWMVRYQMTPTAALAEAPARWPERSSHRLLIPNG